MSVFGEFFAAFFGTLAATGVAAFIGKYLLGPFIEHQLDKALEDYRDAQSREVERLRGEITRFSDVLSRRNEKEFEITHGTWNRVVRAVGTAQGALAGIRRSPSFVTLSEDEAEETIRGLSFSAREQDALLKATPAKRDEIYRRLADEHGLQETHRVWADAKNWFNTNRIFLYPDVRDQAQHILDEIYGAIVRCELGLRKQTGEEADVGRLLMNEANAWLDELERTIQRRFGFAHDTPSLVARMSSN